MAVVPVAAGCEREERDYRVDPASIEGRAERAVRSPGSITTVSRTRAIGREFEQNAYHLAQGKRLFTWFNCTGCHGHGGGGSGPALIDAHWTYGSDIESIVTTIREGRPNGMPSFRGTIPDSQIWQVAAYVRSMAAAVPKAAAPGRSDGLMPRPAENRLPETGLDSRVAPPTPGRPQ